MPTTLYVIRHGQSTENTGESLTGDAPLTQTGREQAERTGAWLAATADRNPTPDVVFASPALRTMETARAIADACGAPIVVDPDICEFGMLYDSPGLTAGELRALAPRVELPSGFPADTGWAAGWTRETKERLHARVEHRVARYTGTELPHASVAIVSHAHFGGFFLGRLFRIPAEELSSNRLRLFNCGVSRITVTERYRQLDFGNHTAHLDGIETR